MDAPAPNAQKRVPKSTLMTAEECRAYRAQLKESGLHEKMVDRLICGTAANWLTLLAQHEGGRAERVQNVTAPDAARLHAVTYAVKTRLASAEETQASESDECDIELLAVCYTHVMNKISVNDTPGDTALLPTDRKEYAICDNCTFITRLEKQHKKRLVSTNRVYCTYSETQSEWDTFNTQLIHENQTPQTQIMVSYGADAKALMQQAFTAKAIKSKRNYETVMESQYSPALYDVRVGERPNVRVTDAASQQQWMVDIA